MSGWSLRIVSLGWVGLLGLIAAPHPAAAQEPPAPEVAPEARAAGAWDERAETPRVTSRLYADAQALAPGQTLRVGVLLEVDPDWHVYWRNSGDAGLATEITWAAPGVEGARFGQLAWPSPHVFEQGGGAIVTYGYADQVLHFTELELPDALPEGAEALTLEATADYLTCKVECIPGRETMRLRLPIAAQPEPAAAPVQELFERWQRRLPRAPEELGYSLEILTSQRPIRPGDELEAQVRLRTCDPSTPAADCPLLELDPSGLEARHAFIPDLAPNLKWAPSSVRAMPGGRGLVVSLQGRAPRDDPPDTTRLAGVLRLRGVGADSPASFGVRVEQTLEMASAGAEVTSTPLPALQGLAAGDGQGASPAGGVDGTEGAPAPEGPEPEPIELGYALLLALLGGALLNAMPCVFPVISLKIASIAKIAHEEQRVMVAHGLAYSAGIVLTMLGLAGAVLVLRALGTQAGWGFQFQDPYFLLALSGVLVVFATNLFGAFEIDVPLGGKLGQVAADAPGFKRSFAEGLLCVLLATPCSAPFLGTAVGFALAGDALTILAIFATLGVGLALPFLLLCALPGWTRLLPKPGPWLEHLKHGLGFSLLATTIWLLWLLGSSFGPGAQARALVLLLALALGGWLHGLVQHQPGGARRRLVQLLAVALIGAAGWWAFAGLGQAPEAGSGAAPVTQQAATGEGGYTWRAFDEQAIARELEAGRPVFVDFTADWCITCKVNERGALAEPAVAEAVARHDVAMFKADWTRRDERIRRVLARHGKGGVPMYLMYAPGAPGSPQLLPELLTTARIVEAIEQAAR